MTAKELAQALDGNEFDYELSEFYEKRARESGLVVVFGYSDDNAEFRGAIDDEVGCYEGGTIRLTKEGVIQEPDCGEEDCKYFKECVKNAKTIEAVWCDDASGASWSYKTDIPHEIFNIYEDGEPFCDGIVFSVEDL